MRTGMEEEVVAQVLGGEGGSSFVHELCELGLGFLVNGMGGSNTAELQEWRARTRQKFTTAAQGLGVAPEQVEATIVALARILLQSAKNKLNQAQFVNEARSSLRLSQQGMQALCEFYAENADKFRQIARANEERVEKEMPRYRNLDWRLECEIASRTLRTKLEPSYLLRLETSQHGSAIFLKADYANLAHVQEELQQALDEVKSVHTQRIMRYIR